TVQSVHQIRAALAGQIFRLPHHQVRVICDNMGGGFGMKGGCYPEYGLSLWASEVTGRPVRWTADRSEGLLSDEQARGSTVQPEPIYFTETIIETAARELGMDPAELRRRNTIPASAMPYTTPLRQTYDSGDFAKNLDDALHLAAYDRIEERRSEARRRGKLLGIGVATTVAATGGRDYEHAEIRFDPAGGVVLITGSMDHGQGHGTTFKQVLSEKLGIDADKIRYRYGDSDLVTMGIGTFGSRSAQLAG